MRKSKIGWLKFAMMNVLKVNSTWAAAKTHCRQDWCCEKEGLGCQWAASIGFRGFVDMIMIVLWLYAVDSVWNLISFFLFFLNPKWSPTALNKKHPSVTQFSQKSKHLTSRAREHRALLGVRSPSASFQQDGTALCGLFVASWTRQILYGWHRTNRSMHGLLYLSSNMMHFYILLLLRYIMRYYVCLALYFCMWRAYEYRL